MAFNGCEEVKEKKSKDETRTSKVEIETYLYTCQFVDENYKFVHDLMYIFASLHQYS